MPTSPIPVQTEAYKDEATFGLDEVIAALSADLKKARKDAAEKRDGGDELFGLHFGAAEVELQFTVQRSTQSGAEGGLSFRVFGVGIGGKAQREVANSSETVHRITLILNPGPPDDGAMGSAV